MKVSDHYAICIHDTPLHFHHRMQLDNYDSNFVKGYYNHPKNPDLMNSFQFTILVLRYLLGVLTKQRFKLFSRSNVSGFFNRSK